ncbi:MAG: BLUF domain-containing protein [Verrucomicrobiota bacterium]
MKPSCRIIYRSISAEEFPTNEDILDLAEVSARNNQRDGITGLLILSGSQFLQVLEGEVQPVNALFQRICRDPRHHSVELVQYENTSETYFQEWNMRLVDLYDLPMEKRSLFMDKYEHNDGRVRIPSGFQLAFALLLDAKAICMNQRWKG